MTLLLIVLSAPNRYQ
uniref:Uncharacterized protein n=1 Tax=Anguilla anguilla TaxID=7936 RepID=A0A0E9SSR3_ANGAN